MIVRLSYMFSFSTDFMTRAELSVMFGSSDDDLHDHRSFRGNDSGQNHFSCLFSPHSLTFLPANAFSEPYPNIDFTVYLNRDQSFITYLHHVNIPTLLPRANSCIGKTAPEQEEHTHSQ